MGIFEEEVFSALKCAGKMNVKIIGNCGENDIYFGDNTIRVRFEGTPLLPDGLTVGGWLDLYECTGLKSLPDDLTVGGWLELTGCTGIKSLPDGLTVGRVLNISGCTGLTSLPDGLTVGGSLDIPECTGLNAIPYNLKTGDGVLSDDEDLFDLSNAVHHSLKDGDYVPGRYIFADGILTHVAREKKIGEYTYYIGKIKGKNVIFDGKNYAHCKTFSDGVLELSFKAAQDRGAEQYSELTVDSVVSKDDAITMYRVITGACKEGTEYFIGKLQEVKPEYKIAEIIDMTRNAYGGETFRNFFERSK